MSKRLWVLPIMVVLLVVGVAGLAQAIPSVAGPTGIVWTPTAEIAAQDLLSVVLTYQSIKPGGDDLRNWEINALGSIGQQAELWVAYQTMDNTFDSNIWGVGAKVQVYRNPQPATAIAIGGGYYSWQDGLLDWAVGLPVEGQESWSNTIEPAGLRFAVRRLLGLETGPPVIPGHRLDVTAVATPTEVLAAGGDVTLTAEIFDTLEKPIQSIHWTLVSPANAGTFVSGQNSDTAVFHVNAAPTSAGRVITFRVTVVSAASDRLTATDTVSVAQAGSHVMSVTASASPTTLNQFGGTVNLSAELTDSLDEAVTWEWTVSPADAGTFTAGEDTANATFLANSFGMYVGDERTITFTATATSTVDSLMASDTVSVLQAYEPPTGGGVHIASIANALTSAPVVGKSALANLTSAKQALGSIKSADIDFDPNNPFVRELSDNDVTTWNVYGVGTVDLTGLVGGTSQWCPPGSKLLGSLGVWYQKVDPDLGDSLSMTEPFVSLKFLAATGTALGLEYRWPDSDLDVNGVFSAVISHAFCGGFAAEAGVTNASPIGLGLDDYGWFVRVGYSFPLGKY